MSKPSSPTLPLTQRALATVERVGNRLPDPAVLFIALLFIVWILSWVLSYTDFGITDPRNGEPLVVVNQLSGSALTAFFSNMVNNFAHFHPIGVVLVAMLGIGVAEHTGFINTGLRAMMNVTAHWLLTPMIILVGIVSHTAADAGYVLVIPLGGVIFHAAGRHPLAGIAAAFAGVSGGFSANFIPSAIDPMLQGISQSAAQIIDTDISLNPLNNFFFTATSSVLIIGLGWLVTDKIVEPRLQGQVLDGELDDLPTMSRLSDKERNGLRAAFSLARPDRLPDRARRSVDGLYRAADLRSVPASRDHFRHQCRYGSQLQRHHRGHDKGHAYDGLLPGHHVLHRPVSVRLFPVQPRRAAGA
jgi:aminobenzoyl-glutamate transport protein